ncbi:hypothetical protein KAFR_0E04400 [Kazachstania africana CBS 2517]|uniref:Uncharacterized protein n=1 Tax=Kazachstania africana (strain ATCC 22294 / BCRC 22015 / CBS 2517 / CECT 1963 / NBRC 1671 / NRRL Y-8276) TaxID=1071382 RepID=H2AW40_KAZAF|nr:hypothetical protein KAFR_0E04400 [Kazachstania africana CBS 2517]CCF58590.1 hypothetical protein KAFR_0E04400 [Kazachstania africana CBS 2517]
MSSSEGQQDRKVAVVTGASSGIGYSVAKELAANGFVVYACSRRMEPMEPLVKEFGSDLVRLYQLDISEYAEIVQLKEYLEKELPGGKLDVLYNNAGQACSYPALDVTNEMVEDCFKVNVVGHINMTSQLAKFVINAKGTIVFTGSVTGLISIPFITIYSATKSAIHQYARGLHLELKPFGVRVINAVTGAVQTNIGDRKAIPENSLYNSKEGLSAFRSRDPISKMSSDSYAKEMVKDILSARNPVDVYRGRFARLILFMYTLLPLWLTTRLLYKKCRLDKLGHALKERDTSKTD